MSMGIKELYGTIDDISSIKNQLVGNKTDDKDRMFKWKHEIEQEDKDRRAKIEKIYDDERKKSAVMRRCNRIYHTFLKKIDVSVYKHLIDIRLDPELQLMRWLRCVLSREFDIDMTLCLWDYIFVGIQEQHRDDRDFGDMYYTEGYATSKDDPLINLDFLWLAMIENIRSEIYKQDIEDWLQVFFHYPEVKGASRLISIASKIENSMFNNQHWDAQLFSAPSEFDKKQTNNDDLRDELVIDDENEQEETKMESKAKQQQYFDPLRSDNTSLKTKKQNPKSSAPRVQEETNFPNRRISPKSDSDEGIEELDNSPKETNNQRNQQKKSNFVSAESDEYSYGSESQNSQFSQLEKDEEGGQSYFKLGNADGGETSKKFMNYLSGGFSKIKEINKQYVDPFVKNGMDQVSKKWNKNGQEKMDNSQKQVVIHEKLRKLRSFLSDLNNGSSIERNHTSHITLECEEDQLHDMIIEVETMMQMTDYHSE